MTRDELVTDLDERIESVENNIERIRDHFDAIVHFLKINQLEAVAETTEMMHEHLFKVQDSVGRMMYHLLDGIDNHIMKEIQ